MENNKIGHAVQVEVLTSNRYLKKSLVSLIENYNELNIEVKKSDYISGFLKKEEPSCLVLIDLDYICSNQRSWCAIYRSLSTSDYYAFISLADMHLDHIPFISLSGSIDRIKKEMMICFKYYKNKRNHSTHKQTLACLTHLERKVLFFMMLGYNVVDICSVLGKCRKTVYRYRANIMKKMNLNNKKELYFMLKLCEFMEYCSFKEKGSSVVNNDKKYVSVNKHKFN